MYKIIDKKLAEANQNSDQFFAGRGEENVQQVNDEARTGIQGGGVDNSKCGRPGLSKKIYFGAKGGKKDKKKEQREHNTK